MELLIAEIDKLRLRGKPILYCGVRHHGRLLLDRAFEDLDPETPLPVYSVSKTVTALLVGKAVEQGCLPGVHGALRELLPEYAPMIPDTLTLAHLLTMTAGYQWPELATFGSDDGVFRQFLAAEDPTRFILEQPRSAAPGEQYLYSSGLSHLLMVVLARATGANPADYARKVLWEPLGLSDSHWHWLCDRRNIPYGGHGLSLTVEGMNRLGQLLGGRGCYHGRQVIDAQYLAAMSAVQVPDTRGYTGYGYQTWIGDVAGHRFFGAFGHGGQRIYIFPALALQVVFLGRRVAPEFGIHERLIRTGILPVINQ